ncbi:MAG: GrpB family protein [Burkholderiales bacterium]|nr:GrpB family protein [Burkholderiales bacterium]
MSQDAEVSISPYQADWPSKFEAEQRLLEQALAPWLCGGIEHIGSTAVPGLAAKPVIDIMAPVRSLEDARDAITPAGANGYLYHPYQGEVMHWFCKPSPACRTHHLHLVPWGSPLWVERIAFRDALRGSGALAREYEALKLQLAEAFRHDRDGYTNAKGPFVHRVCHSRAGNPWI